MRALVVAFAFLTRLPVKAEASEEDLGRSVGFFPLVGVVLGLALAGAGLLLARALPPLLVSVLLVALLALLTGGLHLDGVADLFDAMGGGRGDRARMLELMRDSRIGAHGAAALVLVLLAKVLALGQALERRDFAAVIAFPALARWAVAPAIVFVPYARVEGLGRAFTGSAGAREVATATAVIAVLAMVLGGRTMLLPAAAALGAVIALAAWLRRRLGGLTGDAYGAVIEIAEVAALLAAVAARA